MSKFKRYLSAVLKRTDYDRWLDPQSVVENWNGRNEMIAQMIRPNSSVLEFGAGALKLAGSLPSGCTYTPSDLVGRSPDTIVCDLNRRPLPHLGTYDVVVFSGVLEYLVDCPAVIEHCRSICTEIVASYAVLRGPLMATYFRRRRFGWLNDYSEDALYGLFAESSYKPVEKKQWQSQLVIRFARQPL